MDYFEFDPIVQLAMDGDRRASIAMWERAAFGDFGVDVLMWIQHVAEGVLDSDTKDAGRLRDAAIVRALGLAGKGDKHRALREFVLNLRMFECTRQEMISGARSGITPAAIVDLTGYDPAPYADMTDAELGKIIDRELAKPQT